MLLEPKKNFAIEEIAKNCLFAFTSLLDNKKVICIYSLIRCILLLLPYFHY